MDPKVGLNNRNKFRVRPRVDVILPRKYELPSHKGQSYVQGGLGGYGQKTLNDI